MENKTKNTQSTFEQLSNEFIELLETVPKEYSIKCTKQELEDFFNGQCNICLNSENDLWGGKQVLYPNDIVDNLYKKYQEESEGSSSLEYCDAPEPEDLLEWYYDPTELENKLYNYRDFDPAKTAFNINTCMTDCYYLSIKWIDSKVTLVPKPGRIDPVRKED